MQGSIRKAPFRCPTCGFVQQEPEGLISTYCRSCGDYYEARNHRADRPATPEPVDTPPPPKPAAAMRPVLCHRCGVVHDVSASAWSTICPGCSTGIEFGDITISSNASRPVDTRGKLTIAYGAHLNSAYVVCGEGFVEGQLNGTVHCEGALRLACKGAMNCRVTAGAVIVERMARVALNFPLNTAELTVHGEITGHFECAGTVRVSRTGRLHGSVTARGVIVDRGGLFQADCEILPQAGPRPLETVHSSSRETGGLGNPLPFGPLMMTVRQRA